MKRSVKQLLSGWPSGLVFSVLFSACMAVQAVNQSPSLTQDDLFDMSLEQLLKLRVAVTGSNIKGEELDQLLSLIVIERVDLQATGASTLIDALRKSPFMANGTFSGQNNAPDDSAIGSASLSLVGLGADSTLILVNGQRVNVSPYAYEIDTAFVDLNTIPLSAVDRIEILKDGASAIYGSDAIAGVVNVILRRDITGFEVSATSGFTADGAGEELNVSMLWGQNNERTNHVMMIDLFQRQAIFRDDRDYSASADHRSRGGSDRRSSMGYPGTFSIDASSYIEEFGQAAFDALPDDAKIYYADIYGDDVCPDELITSAGAGTRCRYDFNPPSSLMPQTQRFGMTYIGQHQISNELTARAELSVQRNNTIIWGAPSLSNNNAYIAADNPNHPLADLPDHPLHQMPLQIRRRVVEVGDRKKDVEVHNYRLMFGLEGVFDQWDWSLMYNDAGSSSLERGVDGFFNILRFQEAIDNGSFNVFEPSENSADSVSFFETTTRRDGKSSTRYVSGQFTRDVFSLNEKRNAALALGMVYREESIEDNPDSQYLRGEIVGTDFTQGNASRDHSALYLELALPLNEGLDVQLATRYENYSDFGGTTDPKVAVRWQALNDVTLRASWGSAFRAPSLIQLGLGPSNESPALVDTSRCLITANASDCDPKEYNAVVQGNPDLQPEKSVNFNLGVEWRVTDSLSVIFDYWNYDIDDLISRNAQFIVDTFGNDSNYVVRNEPTTEGVPGEISLVYDTYANIGGLKTDGMDLFMTYTATTSMGQWRVTPKVSYTFSLEEIRPSGTNTANGEPIFETLDLTGEYNHPQIRAELPVRLTKNHWSASVRLNYIGEYRDNVSGGADDRMIDDWLSLDTQVIYLGFDRFSLGMGVANIANEKPPLAQTESVGFDNTVHTVQGRFIYADLTFEY